MSDTYTKVPWRLPFTGRDPEEEHRVSTPLELLFDLCFVVAVAAAAASLHHELAKGDFGGLVAFAMMFFGIWWAWLNYSWFASAYDTGDVVFRLTTFAIMAGVLVLATGVQDVFAHDPDFTVVVIGYLIMRAALIPMWLRVAREHPQVRPVALRYAAGVTLVQALWVSRLLVHDETLSVITFVALALAEMSIPYLAESRGGESTPWHVEHIVERFELFTIIVLGEVILATTQAISATRAGHGISTDLAMLIAGGFLLVLSLWWLYFKRNLADCIRGRDGFVFGYAHYFLLASIAAVGASLAASVEVVQHSSHGLTDHQAVLCVAVAVSIYALSLGVIHAYGTRDLNTLIGPVVVSALAILASQITTNVTGSAGPGILAIGLVLTGAVVDHQARVLR